MKLNVLKELPRSFQASVLLAGWPGMGSVGIGAIDYIRRKLDAVAFAEIDMQSHFTPEAMIVEDGLATFPDPPAHVFYAVEEHDLIIFQSEAQIGGVPGDELLDKILDVGQRVGIDTVLTGAAYLTQSSHKEEAQVLGVANNTEFRDLLASHGVEILKEGMGTRCGLSPRFYAMDNEAKPGRMLALYGYRTLKSIPSHHTSGCIG